MLCSLSATSWRFTVDLAGEPLRGHSALCFWSMRTASKRASRAPSPGFQHYTALILEDLPMSDAVKVGFVPFSSARRGVLVIFSDETLQFGAATRKALGRAAKLVSRAAATNQFKGKSGS